MNIKEQQLKEWTTYTVGQICKKEPSPR